MRVRDTEPDTPLDSLTIKYPLKVTLKMGLWNQVSFPSLTPLPQPLSLLPQEGRYLQLCPVGLFCLLFAPLLTTGQESAHAFPSALPLPLSTPAHAKQAPLLQEGVLDSRAFQVRPVVGPWTDFILFPIQE